MSFNQTLGEDLERANTRASSINYKDYPEFDEKFRLIDEVLLDINAKRLVRLKDSVNDYDTSDDFAKHAVSSQIAKLISEITGRFKILNDYVKDVNLIMKDSESGHEDVEVINYMRQRESLAIKRIKNSLNDFKQYQKRFNTNATIGSEGDLAGEPEGQQQQQQQQQSQIQISYEPINAEQLEQQTIEIEEREREIHRIQQDTQEINDIFQNLATIVNEQQFQIDSIEDNLFNYENDARNATTQLRKAERYQRSSGGRMFCCLIILLVVLGFIILASLI